MFILQQHVSEPQSLCVASPVGPQVHKSLRVLLTTSSVTSSSAKATGNLRSHGQPYVRICVRWHAYVSTVFLAKTYLRVHTQSCVTVLSASMSLHSIQWHHGNRIDYFQADYGISRYFGWNLICDIQWRYTTILPYKLNHGTFNWPLHFLKPYIFMYFKDMHSIYSSCYQSAQTLDYITLHYIALQWYFPTCTV